MHQNKIPPKRDFPVTLIIFWKLIKVIETTTIHFVFRVIHSKSTLNCVDISVIKIALKKYIITTSIFCLLKIHRRKHIEMTSMKKVFAHQYYVKKSTSKRHQYFVQRNYIEKVRWNVLKFVHIWSSTYRYNVNIKSTLNQRIVFIGQWPILEFILTLLLNLLNKNFIRSTCSVNRIRKN